MISRDARDHLEKYWRLGVRFFQEEDYALAAFFALTLMEEVGKVVLSGNGILSGQLDKKALRHHRSKQKYAVTSTLLVNSRVTRIYGRAEERFARWFREDDLFRIRNKSLYMEFSRNGLTPPIRAVPKEDSYLLVCFAGEILAEIQGGYTGTGPNEWQSLLAEVDSFREANPEILKKLKEENSA